MNCKLCQSELENYLEGNLPDGKRSLLEQHLDQCDTCSETLKLLRLADNVIDIERKSESNPFLATRIMSAIEELEQKQRKPVYYPLFGKVLKPVLITATLAIALLLGIVAGNLGRPTILSSQIPDEMIYINDANIESLALFLID
jgi:predicted anti-sigma-YlaC factor YlaD